MLIPLYPTADQGRPPPGVGLQALGGTEDGMITQKRVGPFLGDGIQEQRQKQKEDP